MKKVLVLSLALILLLGITSHGTSSYFSDTETSTGNTFTAWVEECVCYGFNVSDITTNDRTIFTYDVSDSSAISTGFFGLDNTNGQPSGVASVGDYIYVLDQSGKQVYRYSCCGGTPDVSRTFLTFAGSSMGNPTGLAIDGDDMWLVVWGADNLYRYSLTAAFDGTGTLNALQEIPLDANNVNSAGLAIDSNFLYVLDSTDHQFYKYPRSGGTATISRVLAESTASGGGELYSPSGTMFDGTYLWVVDDRQANNLNRAYKYDMTNLFPDDGNTENALWQFDLHSDNKGSTGL